MANAKLNLAEKIYLAHRGRSDAKKGVFNVPSAGKVGDAELWYVSPFVWRELASFDAQRDRLLERKQCSLTVKGVEDNAPAGTKRFSEAIAWLNKQKSILDGKIRLLKLKRENELQAIRDNYSKDIIADPKYAHIMRMYRTQEISVKNAYRNQLQSKYEMQVVLLTEEIRLIEEMKSKVSVVLSRRMLRIWYYYERVQRKNPNLLVAHMVRDTMERMYKSRLTGAYWGVLDAIISERDSILAKIVSTAVEDDAKGSPAAPSE